jgi:hypothetical protein
MNRLPCSSTGGYTQSGRTVTDTALFAAGWFG